MIDLVFSSFLVFVAAVSFIALLGFVLIVTVFFLLRLRRGAKTNAQQQDKIRTLNQEITATEKRINALEELLLENGCSVAAAETVTPCSETYKEPLMDNTKIYRSRNGMIAGVCSGIAERYDFDPVWLQIALVVLTLSTLWPLALYGILIYVLPKEPDEVFTDREQMKSCNQHTSGRPSALRTLEKTREQLEKRLRNLENIVTSRNFDWDKRLNEREERG